MIDLVTEQDNTSEARYTVEAYYKGFRLLLTQPFESGAAIVGLLDRMLEVGFTPRPTDEFPSIEKKESSHEARSHFCSIHKVDMNEWRKNDKVWYSHKVDGGWCTGKK